MSPKAKARAAARTALNRVHCVACGTANKLSDSQGTLGTCSKCKQPIVEALSLLGALGVWSGDQAACEACGTKNSLWHVHCFGCGTRLEG